MLAKHLKSALSISASVWAVAYLAGCAVESPLFGTSSTQSRLTEQPIYLGTAKLTVDRYTERVEGTRRGLAEFTCKVHRNDTTSLWCDDHGVGRTKQCYCISP